MLQETQADGKELSWLKLILLNYSFIRHLEWHEHLWEIKIGVNRAHRFISSSFLQQVSCLFSFFFSQFIVCVCVMSPIVSVYLLCHIQQVLPKQTPTYGHVGKAEKMLTNVSNNRVNMDSIKSVFRLKCFMSALSEIKTVWACVGVVVFTNLIQSLICTEQSAKHQVQLTYSPSHEQWFIHILSSFITVFFVFVKDEKIKQMNRNIYVISRSVIIR